MALDPKIWGPHYWFFLHTVTLCYPLRPNAVTKKKYYEFVNNIPLFIPNENLSSEFSKLLDEFQVSPYLDTRETFVKWMHFMHNKINMKLEKPVVSLSEFYVKYYEKYKNNDIKLKEYYRLREKLIYFGILFCCGGLIYYLHDK